MSRGSHSTPPILVTVVMLGLGLSSCGDPGSAEYSEVVFDTFPSGRVHVHNPAEGQWTPRSAWTLVEDLRLGCEEGCSEELFSQVAYILTDPEREHVYILDYGSQEIRVFTMDGAHVRTLGGVGDGPGELRGAAGLDWGPDGMLWVWGNQRYQVIERSGEEVARYIRPVRGLPYPWMGGFTPDGRYVDFGVDLEITSMETYGDRVVPRLSGRGFLPVVALTPPDRFDTLPPIEFEVDITENGQRKRGERSFVGIQGREGHLWFAITDEYSIHRRTLDGDTLLSFSRPAEPAPVPLAEIDSIVADWARRGISGPQLERSSFATHRWLVTNVLTDDAGHVYVFPHEVGVPAGSAVDVFLESGVYLGRMAFPETVLTEGPPPHVTEEHMWAVVESDLGVPFVARYRIRKPESPESVAAIPPA